MTDDKPKLNGCAIAVLCVLSPFALAAAVLVLWILFEAGQWIGRQ
jgi:hypothetical protein